MEATGRAGQVTCRCTHVYPDGPASYFTFHAVGRHGELSAQWHTIKSAGLDAVIANGGTVKRGLAATAANVDYMFACVRDGAGVHGILLGDIVYTSVQCTKPGEPTLYAVLQVPFSQWQAGGLEFF